MKCGRRNGMARSGHLGFDFSIRQRLEFSSVTMKNEPFWDRLRGEVVGEIVEIVPVTKF